MVRKPNLDSLWLPPLPAKKSWTGDQKSKKVEDLRERIYEFLTTDDMLSRPTFDASLGPNTIYINLSRFEKNLHMRSIREDSLQDIYNNYEFNRVAL